MTHTLLVVLFSLALVPGIIIAILPGVVGILYMFAVAIGFGFADHFVHLSGADMWILTALMIVTLLVEFLAGIIGAKWGGAHWSSIAWGVAGLIIGSFMIPVPFVGSLAGMFIGVLASELYRTNDMRKANKAAVGSFLGWLAGTGFKVAAGILFLALFVLLALM